MQKVELRTTCDACSRSKVKCDGHSPCDRCLRRGTDCHYRPKQKRPVRAKQKPSQAAAAVAATDRLLTDPALLGIRPSPNFAPHQAMTELDRAALGDPNAVGLELHERRTWSVFFSLYKSFGQTCSAKWFQAQLRRMLTFLKESKSHGPERRLRGWMAALNIDPEQSMKDDGVKNVCVLNIAQPKGVDVLVPQGLLKSDEVASILELEREASEKHLAVLVVSGDKVRKINAEFASMFGVTKSELEGILKLSGGGFLPWQGDIMSRLLPKEADLLAYIQVIAIKFNAMGKPASFPATREIPSIHVFDVVLGNGVIRKCLIKALHVETIDFQDGVVSIGSTAYLTFSLMEQTSLPSTSLLTTNPVLADAGSKHSEQTTQSVPSADELGMTDASFGLEKVDLGRSRSQASIPSAFDFAAQSDELWLDSLLEWTDNNEAVPDVLSQQSLAL